MNPYESPTHCEPSESPVGSLLDFFSDAFLIATAIGFAVELIFGILCVMFISETFVYIMTGGALFAIFSIVSFGLLMILIK